MPKSGVTSKAGTLILTFLILNNSSGPQQSNFWSVIQNLLKTIPATLFPLKPRMDPILKHTGSMEMFIFHWDVYLESHATSANTLMK